MNKKVRPGITIDRSLIQTQQEMLTRWGEFDKPLVSISCITYNHEKYIRDALDGFLIQDTDFPFEILVHDDASTDGTTGVIEEYAARYPMVIKPMYEEENQWSKGRRGPARFLFPRAKGEYIALCEGDDYWTDPYKLQRQVNFLEGNPDYSMCFHDAMVVWMDREYQATRFCPNGLEETITLGALIGRNWFVPTHSMVFRKKDVGDLPEWYAHIHNKDYALQLLLANKGQVRYLSEVMGVYRKHQGGVTNNYSAVAKLNNLIELMDLMEQELDGDYTYDIDKRKEALNAILRIQERLLNRTRESVKRKLPSWIKRSVRRLRKCLGRLSKA